jgi:hypothetical protein
MLLANGRLRLRFNTMPIGADSAPLTVGTLYRIVLHQQKGTGADAVLEAFLAEGSEPLTRFSGSTTETWTAAANRFRLGATTATALDATFDDILLTGPGN